MEMLVRVGAVLSSTKVFSVLFAILPAESVAVPLAIAILVSAPLPVTLVSVTVLSVVPEPVTAMVPAPDGVSVIFEARTLLDGMVSAPTKVSL